MTAFSATDVQIKDTYLKRLKTESSDELRDVATDFTAKYLALHHLGAIAEKNPEVIDPETISVIKRTLKEERFSGQRQALFFFRQAAETLGNCFCHTRDKKMAHTALGAFKNVLLSTSGHCHRATAEALSSLPFPISGPRWQPPDLDNIPLISWRRFVSRIALPISDTANQIGRSIVIAAESDECLLVIKMARVSDRPAALVQEPFWMDYLRNKAEQFPLRFNIPEPLKVRRSYIFRLKSMPINWEYKSDIHPQRYAVAFLAHRDYFTYPNDSPAGMVLTPREFKEIICRNAWLLGRLSAIGILHSAPIPLFHNRVQTNRRRDMGLYEWFRAGRLDRWLASCTYPNIGVTGIRDYEHLMVSKGSNRLLYRSIGTHILSLLLIAGSYFRNKNPEKVGIDAFGSPIDARALFDRQVFKEIIMGVFNSYYRGFVREEPRGTLPIDVDRLTDRMIDEMGVDRHMEEILRVADQRNMSSESFRNFLRERCYSADEADKFTQGAEDITIYSGPHLGGFNQPISLPEMIESVETVSALCIAGRFWKTHWPSSADGR